MWLTRPAAVFVQVIGGFTTIVGVLMLAGGQGVGVPILLLGLGLLYVGSPRRPSQDGAEGAQKPHGDEAGY